MELVHGGRTVPECQRQWYHARVYRLRMSEVGGRVVAGRLIAGRAAGHTPGAGFGQPEEVVEAEEIQD